MSRKTKFSPDGTNKSFPRSLYLFEFDFLFFVGRTQQTVVHQNSIWQRALCLLFSISFKSQNILPTGRKLKFKPNRERKLGTQAANASLIWEGFRRSMKNKTMTIAREKVEWTKNCLNWQQMSTEEFSSANIIKI